MLLTERTVHWLKGGLRGHARKVALEPEKQKAGRILRRNRVKVI